MMFNKKPCAFYRGLRAGFIAGIVLLLIPFLYLGAQGLDALLHTAVRVQGARRTRVTTGEFNRLLAQVTQAHTPKPASSPSPAAMPLPADAVCSSMSNGV